MRLFAVRHRRPCGEEAFTLVEVLIAIALLAIVVAIVYESFASVLTTTEMAREASEELRLRQFLSRNLLANISSIWVSPESLANPSGTPNDKIDLVGTGGSMTSLEFTSTAPLSGTVSLPGVMKRVRYIAGTTASDMDTVSLTSSQADTGLYLECFEIPIADLLADDDFSMESEEQLVPGWSVPVRSFAVSYYDGEDWVDEWDSMAMQYLPWAIRVQINFAQGEGSDEWDLSGDLDSPDFEMIIPVPLGEGTFEPDEVPPDPNQPQPPVPPPGGPHGQS